MVCEARTCPRAVSDDCAHWRHEVEQDLPTIRLKITDPYAAPVTPTRVTADGESIAIAAIAAPIILEAGPHTLRVEATGFTPIELDRALRPTDREVEVRVVLQPPEPAKPVAPSATLAREVPSAAWVLAGVGVVGLGASLYFGLSSHSQYDDLKATCAPYCARADADSVRTKALLSDIALVGGAAAIGGAAWLYFGAKSHTAAVQVAPTGHGSALRLHVTF